MIIIIIIIIIIIVTMMIRIIIQVLFDQFYLKLLKEDAKALSKALFPQPKFKYIYPCFLRHFRQSQVTGKINSDFYFLFLRTKMRDSEASVFTSEYKQ